MAGGPESGPAPAAGAPAPDPGPAPAPRPLDSRVLKAWLFEGLITAAFVTLVACGAEWFVFRKKEWWPLPPGAVAAAAGAVSVALALALPALRYRAWRYTVRAHDVVLSFGVVWRVTRSIPRVRIQHADVHSGPLDRWCGIVNLTLYTAGTGEADARIPGLRPEDAEALREGLLRPEAEHA